MIKELLCMGFEKQAAPWGAPWGAAMEGAGAPAPKIDVAFQPKPTLQQPPQAAQRPGMQPQPPQQPQAAQRPGMQPQPQQPQQGVAQLMGAAGGGPTSGELGSSPMPGQVAGGAGAPLNQQGVQPGPLGGSQLAGVPGQQQQQLPVGGQPGAGGQAGGSPPQSPGMQTQLPQQPQSPQQSPDVQGTPPGPQPGRMSDEAYTQADAHIRQVSIPALGEAQKTGDSAAINAAVQEHGPAVEANMTEKMHRISTVTGKPVETLAGEYAAAVDSGRPIEDPEFIETGISTAAEEEATTEAAATGESVEAIKEKKMSNPTWLDKAVGYWGEMSPAQQIGTVLGGGLAIAGIVNMLFNGGGLMSLLTTLGGAAMGASAAGLFGPGGNIADLFSDMTGMGGKPPETPAPDSPEAKIMPPAGTLGPNWDIADAEAAKREAASPLEGRTDPVSGAPIPGPRDAPEGWNPGDESLGPEEAAAAPPTSVVDTIMGNDDVMDKTEFGANWQELMKLSPDQQQELLRSAGPELRESLKPMNSLRARHFPATAVKRVVSTIKKEHGIDLSPEQAQNLIQQVQAVASNWG